MPDHNHQPSPERRVYDRLKAADYLGISVRLLDSLTASGEIAHFRLRSRVLYDREGLDQAIKNHERRGKPLAPEDAVAVTAKLQCLLDAWQAADRSTVAQMQTELASYGVIVPSLPRGTAGGNEHV